jgi:regulator of sigma E protease
MLITLVSFLVALSLLVFVHEYGHYRAALWCGVKVERFSIGFGKPVLKWSLPGRSTEFVIGLLPLGGYVRMVDERQGPVAPEDRSYAFNTKSLSARACIVAAGPLANLMLAVLLYAGVNWTGMLDAKPLLASPATGSIASQAGLRAGDWVRSVAIEGASEQPVQGYSQLAWLLTQALLEKQTVVLRVSGNRGETQSVVMNLSDAQLKDSAEGALSQLGLRGVYSPAVLGPLSPDGAAQKAGLKEGDAILSIEGRKIVDAADLRDVIRASHNEPIKPQIWEIERQDRPLSVQVEPIIVLVEGQKIGRIGAQVGLVPETVVVRYGFLDGLQSAFVKTGEMAYTSVSTLARMLIGQASIKHISGPLSIAQYAGKTAQRGWQSYVLFLAVISVSLGVLNLLPIPVLDGGHLMYYLWEALTGQAVSDRWMEILQKGGVAVILMLMLVGLLNDFSRIFN